jgi:hypothetical protein
MTAPSTFSESLKQDILALLADKPLNTAELAERLQAAYQTTRRCMVELEAEGRIMRFDRKARGARYTLGTANGPTSIVPYVKFGNKDYKLTNFNGVVNLPTGMADAAHAVLKAWTTIAITAERLHNGVPDDVLVKRLNREKTNLAKARSAFEAMAFLINQLIDQPKLWDITALSQFPDDKDWPEFHDYLQAMYDHYYNPTTESPTNND